MRSAKQLARAFALYEVLLGLSIFVVGVVMLGRSVEHCLNATSLSSDEDKMRQILANRMAEIQATPGFPDEDKQTKIDTGSGEVTLIQRCDPAGVRDEKDLEMGGIIRVALRVDWRRAGQTQTKRIEFYVYRGG